MGPSLVSLAFGGSIPEAISLAKAQKKLFVVYISGDNAESEEMENSTWKEGEVSESVKNYCVLLHIPKKTTDAENFSKMYPQSSVPSVTAVGYNGVKLWQKDGFVAPEDLASSLEKAWLSLQIQETTASFLTTAMAARNPEQTRSNNSRMALVNQDNSSSNGHLGEVYEASGGTTLMPRDEIVSENIAQETTASFLTNAMAARNPEQTRSNNSRMALVNQDNSSSNGHLGEVYEASGGTTLIPRDEIVSENIAQRASHGDSSNLVKSENLEDLSSTEVAALEDSQKADSGNLVKDAGKSSRDIVNERNSNSKLNKLNVASVERDDAGNFPEVNTSIEHPSASQTSDVYLNIRLLSGASIQEKFSLTDTLRTVKELVDSKSESSIGSYNLATPYPRKVFLDAELSKTLSELGLSGRQALIVVPNQRGDVSSGGDFPSSYQRNTVDGSSDGDSGGHYGILKRIFSYVNPFSYLGYFRHSAGTTESEDGGSGYGPNHTLQSGGATRVSAYNDHPTAGRVIDRSKRPTTSRFGSNIHTLKHDEDDDRFGDRNAFWNGNSTQYGGDSDSK